MDIEAERIMNCKVDVMREADWNRVAEIYAEGIKTKIATFQSTVPTWEEWNKEHCEDSRLVARADDTIFGWAALSPVSGRCVYAGVAEVSIYVDKQYQGQRVGTVLLEELIKRSEKSGYWTLQSGIIKENVFSLNLHKKCGFREIGYREKLGQMDNGKWHDVVLVERRSKICR